MKYIFTEYIEKAMSKSIYDKLDDGSYAGKIPECQGVLAFGKSLKECEDELRSTLEDWIFLGIKLNHNLPIIDGINLNRIPEPVETY